ncbi:rCG51829 [Rattus norvegicus]|uniref:RCG51829 n=1 Tax=Rattus norvegicus TaxID=10116 RepID=A6K3I8_RAT|nr:rCG51829 [Rattus norvegicus]
MCTHSGQRRWNPFGKKLFQYHRKQRGWLATPLPPN